MHYLQKKIKHLWLEHEILRKFTAVFSVDVIVKATGFLLLPVYLGLMSQDEFGLYNYWISIVSVFYAIFSLGIPIAQSRLYFDYPDLEKKDFLFTLNILFVILLFALLSVIYIFQFDTYIIAILFKNKANYENYRYLLLLGIIVTIYSNLLLNYFVTVQNIKMIQIYNIARLLAIHVIVIILLSVYQGDAAKIRLKSGYLLELGIIALFSVFYIKEMGTSFRSGSAIKILKLAIPYTLASIPGLAIIFADKYYLEKFTDYKSMSVYYLAVTVSSVIPIILASLQNIWMPAFFKEKNLKKNIKRTKKLIIPLLGLLIFVSLMLYLFIKILLVLKIVSHDYEQTLSLLPIMFLSQLLISIATILQLYLVHFKKTVVIFVINVLFLLPSVLLTRIMTMNYNINGAALSFLIINIAGLVIYFLVIKKFINLRLKSD